MSSASTSRTRARSPDEALIGAGMEKSRTCLAALSKLKAPGDWLLGDQLTLADLHAAPMFGYFVKAPEGRAVCSPSIRRIALVDARWACATGRSCHRRLAAV